MQAGEQSSLRLRCASKVRSRTLNHRRSARPAPKTYGHGAALITLAHVHQCGIAVHQPRAVELACTSRPTSLATRKPLE